MLTKILENLNKYNKLKFIFKYVKIFLLFLPLFLSALTHPSHTNEISLEEEIKEAFKDYPFKCNPEGSTPEMAACIWIDLIKSDRALRKELNDPILYREWVSSRNKICNHFQDKMYAGGTVRQLTRPGCALRVNSEIQKYCIISDPSCG